MIKIKFDTRDKKPKLYNLLIITLIAASIIAAIIFISPQNSSGAVCIVSAVYCLSAALTLLYSFFEQIKYNPYSYNTIFYFGFSLFSVFVTVTYVALAVRCFKEPEVYDAHQLLYTLLNSGKNYIIFTSPFILAFSAALCVSNVSLLKHEGKRPVNFLGIILSLLLVGGAVFIFTADFAASGSQTEVMIHDIIVNFIAAVYLYFECMITGVIAANAVAARYEPDKNLDCIIILGCGLKKDGAPTPLLRGRVERAVRFYEAQKKETGHDLIFITSGGKGTDEISSESAAMKRCLLEFGVPEEIIAEEDKSTTTYENMKFSKKKIEELGIKGKIAFATTKYHVFRSGIFARRMKLKAVGIGAETKWYFWPNAAVREFGGLLIAHKIKQTVIFLSMAAFYIIATVLAYKL